jgi:hypothetical protein
MAVIKGAASASGFTLATTKAKHRLIMSIEGTEKCGKNHFAFTAPGPVYFHSLDFGDEGVIQKFQPGGAFHRPGLKIHKAEYRLDIPPNTAIQDAADTARPVWSRFLSNFAEGLAKGRTTIVDTATEAYEVLRMAEFGKLTQVMPHHYGPVNQVMKGLWRDAYNSDSNLIMLHRMKEEWENKVNSQGKEVGNKTGRWEMAGYKGTYFEAQVCCRAYKEGGEFKLLIFDCRQNPDLEGMVLEQGSGMLDFKTLGQLVFPESEESEWQ